MATATLQRHDPAIQPKPRPIPPLEPGDVLTRAEFERRYEAMPNLKHAELIEGVVHMPMAVRLEQHGEPHAMLITWLGLYVASTPGVSFGDNTSVRLDLDNEPQPDALMMIKPQGVGQAQVDDEGYVAGAPELVAEVAASTASIDLHAKLRAYRRNGVREYLVWRVLDKEIDWFVLREGEYVRQEPMEGPLRSALFPGLWLEAAAMIKLELARVLKTLQDGIASAEHAEFVGRLASENPIIR